MMTISTRQYLFHNAEWQVWTEPHKVTGQAPECPLDSWVLWTTLFGCPMITHSTYFNVMTSSIFKLNTHPNGPISVGCVYSMPQKKLWSLLSSFFTFFSPIFLYFYSHSQSSIPYNFSLIHHSSQTSLPGSLEPHHSHQHCCNSTPAPCQSPCFPAPIYHAQATQPISAWPTAGP